MPLSNILADCLMTEVVEGEVGYSRSFPQPVPSLTEGHVSYGEGAFLVLMPHSNLNHLMAPTSTNHSLSNVLVSMAKALCVSQD